MSKNVSLISLFSLVNFICFFIYSSYHNVNVLFWSIWFVCILIIVKAKFSFFSSLAFIISYITIPVYFQYNFGHSYGMIELDYIPLYTFEIYLYVLIGIDILMVFLLFTKILEREKKIYDYIFDVSDTLFVISCIGAVLFAFVAFPRMPFIENSSGRFDMLLPGKAWNHLSVIFLIIATSRIRKSFLSKITVLLTLFWFLSHGERVDMIGYFLGLGVYYFNTHKISKKNIFIAMILGISVVMGLNMIGNIRNENSTNTSSLFYNLLVQKTAADLAYVFNSAIHYTHVSELYYGKTYTSYIYNLIPFMDVPYLTEILLRDMFKTAGGEFLYCEPIINFGLYGFIVFEIIELSFLNLLFSKVKYKYIRYCILFMIFTQFRIIWYGRTYIMTGIFVFIPIILVIDYFLEQRNFSVREINTVSEKIVSK